MKSLEGKRILVTRSAADNAVWAAQLRNLGAEVFELACIERCTLESAGEDLVPALVGISWLVLPSPMAVATFAKLASLPANVQIACVGEASRQLAEQRLGRCDLVSSTGTMAGLSEDLGGMQGATILVAGAEEGTGARLSPRGSEVRLCPTYRTTPISLGPSDARGDAQALGLDAIFLASPSALTGLQSRMEVWETPLITLGPTTSGAVTSRGLTVSAEAESRDLEGLINAFQNCHAASKKSK